MVFAADQVQRL